MFRGNILPLRRESQPPPLGFDGRYYKDSLSRCVVALGGGFNFYRYYERTFRHSRRADNE